MPYDDEDDAPPTRLDPEELQRASRERIASLQSARRRILRWTYAALGVLVIIVVLLATLR